MTELGKRLREAREEKGLTLDDLQDLTKIQKRYLQGIEEGNFDIIPGKFYVRAFIKQYAEAVGLDPDELFEEYKQEIPSVYESEDLTEQISRSKSRRTVQSKTSKIMEHLPKAGIAILVIGILVLIWIFAQNMIGSKETSDSVQNQAADEDVSFEQSGNQPEEDETKKEEMRDDESGEEGKQEEEKGKDDEPTIEIVEQEGNTTTYHLTDADTFELELKATEGGQSWIGIHNLNDEQILETTITEDSPETLDLSDESGVRIRIGNAPAVEVYVNDEQLDIPSDSHVQNIIIQYGEDDEGQSEQ
mgnify:CR=1 FL=1